MPVAPRDRYLPDVPDRGFVVGGNEPLAAALHRLTTEQFSIAIDALSDPSADVAIATTATLDAMHRIAAVLRLVRTSIGDEAYRTERRILDETIELLSGLTDGQAELRALDQLRRRFEPLLQDDAFAELRGQLLRRHQLKRLQALSEGVALEETLVRLRRARARFAAWPLDDRTDARMYGREPVQNEFSSLAAGLARTYKRGRRHWRAARDGDLTAYRSMAREVRLLGDQLQVIGSAWPELLGAAAQSCEQLEAILAEHAGLEALVATLEDPGVAVDDVERAMLEALVTRTRAELRGVCGVIGRRVFVEPTRLFIDRMEAYWEARDIDVPLDHR